MPTNSATGDQPAPPVSHLATEPPTSSSAPSTPVRQPNGAKHNKWKHTAPPPPTNCVVLKNLDYNITQVTLEDIVRRVTGGRKEFVNVSLVDDKHTGSFRGMAFVNFHSVEDATAALAELSKMVINGRKVFAEYRRLKPGERDKFDKRAKKFDHFSNQNRQTFEKDVPDTDEKGLKVDKRAAFFAKRDTVKKADDQKRLEERAERDKEKEAEFRKILLAYYQSDVAEGAQVEDLVFDATLTSYERRMIHTICNSLDLGHISKVDEDGNRVLHVTKHPERKAEWDKENAKIKPQFKKEDQQKRKNKENLDGRTATEWKKAEASPGGPLTREETQGIKWFKPRAALAASSETAENNGNSGIRAPSYKLYIPPRQPIGPDGTIGFTSRCAAAGVEVPVGEPEVNGDVTEVESDEQNGEESVPESGDVEEKVDMEGTPNETEVADNGGRSSHTVLNPSVPAFEPSFTQSY